MMSFSTEAFAKINLTLDVAGRREDGYHLMHMVMQTVSLSDLLTLDLVPGHEIRICSTNGSLPCGESNTVCRAARAFFSASGIRGRGVSFQIAKRIPWQAGLGGGSADAAAALRLLNRTFETSYSQEELCEIGLSVGADVPFCLTGGTALVQGIGERIEPLPQMPECHIVICKPVQGIATAGAFAQLDASGRGPTDFTGSVLRALKTGGLPEIAAGVGNAFEAVVKNRTVFKLRTALLENGALGACMTGTGSAVFGIFPFEDGARACTRELRGLCREIFVCKPVFQVDRMFEFAEKSRL